MSPNDFQYLLKRM
nr:unnamed protein product [Callosobruchus chinensis]CAH7764904.1 unnamed protein product [Callosobruchus chinensis]